MSYNIDSVDIVNGGPITISRADLDELWEDAEDSGEVPEVNLFDQGIDRADVDGKVQFESAIWWSGEGSGGTFDRLVEHVLPAFDGDADLVICFEGGDSYEGLRLRDHKVTRHEVIMSLGNEV
jgi:hypothetical protein